MAHRLIDCNTGLSWAPRTTERTTTWKSLFRLRRVVCQSPIIRLSLYRTLLDNNNCNIHFAGCPQCGHCHQSPTLACPPIAIERGRQLWTTMKREEMPCRRKERSLLLANAKLIFISPISAHNCSPTLSIYLSIDISPSSLLRSTTMPRIRLHPKPPNLATPIYHHNIHLPALIKDNVTVDCLRLGPLLPKTPIVVE